MKWTGLLVGERAIGENSIIDFLLDGIVQVTVVIIPTHLIYYHYQKVRWTDSKFNIGHKNN